MVEAKQLNETPKKYNVKCPHCHCKGVFSQGPQHGLKTPSWVCVNFPRCDAYVGCHKGTNAPLGLMANASLRKARQSIHARIDAHWRRHLSKITRKQVYKVIELTMGLKSFHVASATQNDADAFDAAWPLISKNLAAMSFGFNCVQTNDCLSQQTLRQAIQSTQHFAGTCAAETGLHK